jgi:hypothetical protein
MANSRREIRPKAQGLDGLELLIVNEYHALCAWFKKALAMSKKKSSI